MKKVWSHQQIASGSLIPGKYWLGRGDTHEGKGLGRSEVADVGDVSFLRAHFRPQRASPPNHGVTDSSPRLEGQAALFVMFTEVTRTSALLENLRREVTPSVGL